MASSPEAPDATNPEAELKMERQRLQVFYSGHVQGVGFRYQVKSLARGYEVTGRVRNLADGRVELLAEGEQSELEEFRKAIQDSDLGHFVRGEEAGWSEAKNEFRGFEIVP
jgi:acylphosphatase